MADAKIPLNYFVRRVFELTTTPTLFYTAPFRRAAILLNAYATNTTSTDKTITIGVSGEGNAGRFIDVKPYYDYAKDVLIAGRDTTNMFPAKFVLEEFDCFIASASEPGVTLNVSILETRNEVQ